MTRRKGTSRVGCHNKFKTPLTATCLKTGKQYHFESMVAAELEGYSQSGVSIAVRGVQASYMGMKWEGHAEHRIAPRDTPRRRTILELWNTGKYTVAEVASKVGCTWSTANYHIKQDPNYGSK